MQQLCEDTGCSPEDLPEAMNDRERWRERVGYIRADGTTRLWDDDIRKHFTIKYIGYDFDYKNTLENI